ncbi:MAG: hypothetical protein IT370_15455 [Deltaproteobacteria bacterium]|nr:hypothetical protein [Deltaproteobacteria bacterium]
MSLIDRAQLGDFFAAIHAERAADAPRLALADFLTARGDARGDNIRLECALEYFELGDPARAALVARAAALPRFTYYIETPPWNTGYSRRRGFIDEVEWRPAHFAAHGAELVRAAPLSAVSILDCHRQGAVLAACPALAELPRLRLPTMPLDDVFLILASPHLTALPSLELSSLQLDAALATRLVLALRPLHGLRHLDLSWGPIDAAARAILGDFARAAGVTIPRLLPPPPAPPPSSGRAALALPRFGRANLGDPALSPAALTDLLAGGPYPAVQSIDLGEVPDDSVAALLAILVESPALPALRTIERSRTWRCTGREEVERSIITRPDGRPIDVLVWHSIWP